MVRSMIAGVAGLRAHQSKMDVIGNNIANVNTWGFKGYSYNFKDSMYTNSINSSGGSVLAGASGGRNASQVGYGSQLSSISNVFETGAPSPSSRPMDCMIDGTGFFLVGPMVNGSFTDIAGSGLYLSRVGIFSVDENGYLVDDQRSYVYGYALVEGTGIPDSPATASSQSIGQIEVQFTKGTNGALSTISIGGVSAETTVTDIWDLENAVNDWISNAPKGADATTYEQKFGNVKIELDAIQRELTPTPDGSGITGHAKFTITANQTGTASTQTVTTAIGQLGTTTEQPEVLVAGSDFIPGIQAEYATQLSTLRIPINPDTNQRYKLENYSIREDGTVIGVDEQKRVIPIGQVALISVENPNGLEKTDGYYYTIGDNTGDVYDVKPSTGPTGKILGSYLEMANVDLANEFSNLITTQRGFQANSKIITVTDEMLQELVNMKR